MLLRRPALFALLCGIISATGFAPFALWPIALLALGAWLLLVNAAPTARAALLRGWLFGLGHFTLMLLWIQHPFTFQHAVPSWTGYLAVPLLAAYLAIFPMAAAGLGWRVRGRAPDSAFVLAMGGAWIVAEGLRATLFTGFAWNPLATIWLPVIGVAQAAAWIGSYALSGLTVIVAGAGLLLVRRDWKLAAIISPIVALLALSGIDLPMTKPAAPGNAPRLVIVQPNLPEEADPGPDYAERNLATLLALTGPPKSDAPRLIMWPEGALRYLIEDGYPPHYYFPGEAPLTRGRIAAILGPRDIVLTGGDALQFDKAGQLISATNSVFAINSRARLIGRYDKAHLVPFGEYLPLRTLTSLIGLNRLVQGDIDFAPGAGPATRHLPVFGAVGIDICYEIIFSGQIIDPARRPALVFNPSNDSWFGEWGPVQHLAQARLRAIEEGVPIVRATPSGVSAVIGADGRLLGTISLHRSGVIDLAVPAASAPTLFARLGNWMAALVAALLIAAAVAIRRRAR